MKDTKLKEPTACICTCALDLIIVNWHVPALNWLLTMIIEFEQSLNEQVSMLRWDQRGTITSIMISKTSGHASRISRSLIFI